VITLVYGPSCLNEGAKPASGRTKKEQRRVGQVLSGTRRIGLSQYTYYEHSPIVIRYRMPGYRSFSARSMANIMPQSRTAQETTRE
jgi:hypothetical protein